MISTYIFLLSIVFKPYLHTVIPYFMLTNKHTGIKYKIMKIKLNKKIHAFIRRLSCKNSLSVLKKYLSILCEISKSLLRSVDKIPYLFSSRIPYEILFKIKLFKYDFFFKRARHYICMNSLYICLSLQLNSGPYKN